MDNNKVSPQIANLNCNLAGLNDDYLYHLDLAKNKSDLSNIFSDVKVKI
jgi:hypothetical protein